MPIARMKYRIRDLREAKGISQERMAETLGISPGLYSMLERGKRRMNETYLDGIADALGVRVSDLLDDPGLPVAVAGKVGAGAQVDLVDAYEKGDGLYHVACPPPLAPDGVVGVEVEGSSMEPVYNAGDVLFYHRKTHEGIPDDDIGRQCVVADTDGKVWVKQVKRGDEPGRFHLISVNPGAETIWNSTIQWGARVKMALPSELVRRV